MSDELDPVLLRAFAQSKRPFPDAEFLARVTTQIRPRGSLPGIAWAVSGALAAVLGGLATGLAAPLRLRYAGLVAFAGAGVTLWSLLTAV